MNRQEQQYLAAIKGILGKDYQKIDYMAARELAEYIAEQVRGAECEKDEAYEDGADHCAQELENAARDYLYREDRRELLDRMAAALEWIPTYGFQDRIKALAIETY